MEDFQKAKQYVINLLGTDLSSDFIYHDLGHTLDVYHAATRLGKLAKLSDHDLLLLQTGALYHDVGLIFTYENHENKSNEIANQILPSYGYTIDDIKIITNMIDATKMPQSPKTKIEELLCDADLDYLGRDDFFLLASKLHLEWTRMKVREIQFDEWILIEKEFLSSHQYFTLESQELRDAGKSLNLKQLFNICKGK